jgi:predicted dehydrogenase
MKKYKVGLVGVRRGSSYLSVFANNPRTEIAAVCDLKHEPLVEIAKQYHLNDNRLFLSKSTVTTVAPVKVAHPL